ncbi:MAG: sugar phosphate isomerase/epimerase [Caldilineaceae bacterium]|nr:sugar phosphate isomerase/epimerase [Caldilineaceae bacterium]
MTRLLSISAVAYDGHDLPTALRHIRELGVERAELAFIKGYSGTFDERVFDEANARHIRDLLDEAGLSSLALSAQMDLTEVGAVHHFTRRLHFAQIVGARIVITNAGPPARRAVFDDNIRELATVAQSLGMIIALENPGDGRASIVNDGPTGAAVIEEIGSPAVRLNYDFGNVISHFAGRVRPEEDYKAALPYAAYLHIKDVQTANNPEQRWSFPAVGRGEIDYAAILADLAACAPDLPISIEIPTRVSRAADASPRIAPHPRPLAEVDEMLRGSVEYMKEQDRRERY